MRRSLALALARALALALVRHRALARALVRAAVRHPARALAVSQSLALMLIDITHCHLIFIDKVSSRIKKGSNVVCN